MADWLMKMIRAEAQRLLELSADDPTLRADLRALAEEILAATALPSPPAPAEEPLAPNLPRSAKSTDAVAPGTLDSTALPPSPLEIFGPEPELSGQAEPVSEPRQEPQAEPRHELTLGQSRPLRGVGLSGQGYSSGSVGSSSDLDSLSSRCRRKSEAARWAAECQREIREGTGALREASPLDQELARWADTLCDGVYWRSSKNEASPTAELMLDEIAGCFEAVAESLTLVRESEGRTRAFERALQYLAEAQSGLRRALQRVGLDADPDQEEVYQWLRSSASRHRIYVRRHMRADDLADPAEWPSILSRIEEARSAGRKTPAQVRLFEQAREHQERIKQKAADEADWSAFIGAIDRLVADGIPPSSRELRECLLPVVDDVPDREDFPRGFRLVLREVDRFLATRSASSSSPSHHEPTAPVKQVARLLAGKSVVLIGGSRRRDAQEAITRLFGLESLLWLETREHQAVTTFEPVIARPDVALVLLAIRWSSHSFGEVRHLCERHGKLLVRLPGGYNPNQVAAQILAQCSNQL
ncbi:MAG: hypothetical protein JO161_07760 [Planctomycetaceae bacterium]|nr:hypothetical protein [Planctomycetaceae bacterium]